LNQLKWVMEQSLVKTLAAKHKAKVTKISEKYRAEIEGKGKKYKGLQASIPREGKKPLVATWGGIPLVWSIKATLEEQPPKLYAGQTELEKRLLAGVCEFCGNEEDVEIHHILAMKDIHKH